MTTIPEFTEADLPEPRPKLPGNPYTAKDMCRYALAAVNACLKTLMAREPASGQATPSEEEIEQLARNAFNPDLDWTLPENLGVSAVQRSYFHTGFRKALELYGQVSAASPLAVLRAHAEARVHHIYNGLCPEEAGLHDSRDPECPVCAALADIMPSASAAPAISLLAPDHRGMRVDYTGLLKQVRNALRQCDERYLHEGVFQLGTHLKEMGQRWYAGDTAVVDEFLQLYCIEREARAAIVRGAGDSKS